MALPGRDKTFAFENCRCMLDKLKREIERHARVDGSDVEAMKDLAFNIAVTGVAPVQLGIYGPDTSATRCAQYSQPSADAGTSSYLSGAAHLSISCDCIQALGNIKQTGP